MENNYAIIMAGGIGSRFWPFSTHEKPKQFLDILGTGRSLIQLTFDRLSKVCPSNQIYIVTNNEYEKLIAPIINTLGYFYYNIGNKEEAKNLFEEYLILYPDGYNSYDSMGEFYYNEGDMENALKFYKKAKEMYPAATSANMMIEEISKS